MSAVHKFEACADARWLGAQAGWAFRLPSEVEWEAAARGKRGRHYPCGDRVTWASGNTVQAHVRQTTPGGVFPEGDTPDGVCDLLGNVTEWTSSAVYDEGDQEIRFAYPYRPDDGRECLDTSPDRHRVMRGGCWSDELELCRAVHREEAIPDFRAEPTIGMRLALSE